MIDTDAIAAITSLQRPGKPDLLARVVGLFEANSPGLIDTINTAHAAGDFESMRAAAHSMKSSAAYLGATDFAQMCKNIEKAGHDQDADACAEDVAQLQECFNATMGALQMLQTKAA